MTTLATENLRVSLGGRVVLDGISADFSSRGLIGLIGPNGAGKSTLARTLARLLTPDSGRVLLDGADIATLDRRDLARRVAYLPQGHALHWPLNAGEVVALGRLPHLGRLSPASSDDDAAITRAMEKADVLPFAHRVVTTLSGGERARIMLARALAVEAPVLLADEPVASLDPYHQLHVMELLRDQARAGSLIVAVLHDLHLATRFCDRLILLNEGRLAAQGTPAEVLSNENLRIAYGVDAVRGREADEDFVLAWRRLAI